MGFIFQKEWLKTKYILIGSFAAILFSFINFIVSIDNGIEFNKPAVYINGIVYYEQFSFGSFLLINVIIAGILGLYQFFKERENGRLRIHLHLPYTYFHNINSMVAFGGLSLLVIFTIEFILFWAFASYYFPVEIVSVLSVKLIISFLISFATYFSAPAVMVEPNKIKNIA
ncbi:MAG: hypothetical protein OIF32_12905, partial [Campylobacterales bacterium]|nr:hypothetical protein [Campylobacterales bacterium]